MKIGEKIRKMRDLKGFSQENMAQSMGISISAYGKIERDETEITLTKLEEIAKVFQVNIIDILKFDEQSVFINTFDNKAVNNKGNFIFNQHNLDFAKQAYSDTIEAHKRTIETQKEFLNSKEEIINSQKELILQLKEVAEFLKKK